MVVDSKGSCDCMNNEWVCVTLTKFDLENCKQLMVRSNVLITLIGENMIKGFLSIVSADICVGYLLVLFV